MHLPERREAALEKVLQHGEARDPRRLPHHDERSTDERLPDVDVEARADVADQLDLPRARRPIAHAAIGAAVVGDGQSAVAPGQLSEQRPVELLRQRIELHRLRHRRDDARGQHPHQQRHDTREIRIAAREVRVARRDRTRRTGWHPRSARPGRDPRTCLPAASPATLRVARARAPAGDPRRARRAAATRARARGRARRRRTDADVLNRWCRARREAFGGSRARERESGRCNRKSSRPAAHGL